MSRTIVINLFGQPSAGKSTGAAYIFSRLKEENINCELITEFAKDLTWEENNTGLSCQEYIFGQQSYRQFRCKDKVDVIITDSPLPLGIFYNNNPILGENFEKTVMDIFNSYCNYNYLIMRVKPYNPIGRNQTQEEADLIGDKIQDFLDEHGIIYTHGVGNKVFFDYIVEKTINDIKLMK